MLNLNKFLCLFSFVMIINRETMLSYCCAGLGSCGVLILDSIWWAGTTGHYYRGCQVVHHSSTEYINRSSFAHQIESYHPNSRASPPMLIVKPNPKFNKSSSKTKRLTLMLSGPLTSPTTPNSKFILKLWR